jgi:hypothetical protein
VRHTRDSRIRMTLCMTLASKYSEDSRGADKLYGKLLGRGEVLFKCVELKRGSRGHEL